ncbi:hypothetical protein NBRC116598_05300 [Pseudophaeobacter arcticus]|uniref:Fatty acid desaturase n=1 Tax=Pseudophaeobacter arcticus TaxID=385492 RepID=A0ABQ0AGT7_9RHOB
MRQAHSQFLDGATNDIFGSGFAQLRVQLAQFVWIKMHVLCLHDSEYISHHIHPKFIVPPRHEANLPASGCQKVSTGLFKSLEFAINLGY